MIKPILFSMTLAASLGFAQMSITGSAYETSPCNCYQLTDDVTDENGHIWSPGTIDLDENFDFNFQIKLGDEDVWGADGMMFVLQSGTVSGGGGNGLGYFGIPNSIGIEVDIWNSNPAVPTDIASDHVGISTNGTNNHNLAGPVAIPNVEDNAFHDMRIIWVASANFLTVMIDGITYITIVNDLVTNYFGGNPNVHWGFTASTGGVSNAISVCFDRSVAFTQDAVTICPGLDINFTDASSSDLNQWTWAWDFQDGTPIDNSENPSHSFTNPGVYNVELTITDPTGCETTTSTAITIKDSLGLTLTSNDATCFGLTDGTGNVMATTGVSPWTYAWNDPASTSTPAVSDLAPTAYYTVTVTDAQGCVGVDSVLINEPAELIVDVIGTDASCFGGNDGSAISSATGGTGVLGYSWDDALTQTTSTAINLTAGDYNVTVTDANGCDATGMITINEPSEITATTAASGMDDGSGSGSLDIDVSGGTPGYTFAWSNGSTSEDLNNVGAGSYTVTITDANGCTVVLTFQIGSSVGFNENALNFSIYPNPTNGAFIIQGLETYTIAVMDLQGKLVYSGIEQGNATIDLSEVEAGIYMVRIEQDGKFGMHKLIKE